MDKLIAWLRENKTQSAWFLIGFFVSETLTALSRGDLGGAFLNATLATINYFLNRK